MIFLYNSEQERERPHEGNRDLSRFCIVTRPLHGWGWGGGARMRRVCTRAASNGRWCWGSRLRRSCRREGQYEWERTKGRGPAESRGPPYDPRNRRRGPPSRAGLCSLEPSNLLVRSWARANLTIIALREKNSHPEKPGTSVNLVIILLCASRACLLQKTIARSHG